MSRKILLKVRLPIAVATAGLVCGAVASAQPITPVYPLSGAGGAYQVIVVSDNFTSQRQGEFNDAVQRLFTGGSGLLTDAFFAANAARFTVSSVFVPSPYGSSRFGIVLKPGVTECAIDWDPDPDTGTTYQIESSVQTIPHTRVVVIGDYPGYHFGCTQDTWTYLAIDARYETGTIKHEFGHDTLKDEYFTVGDYYTGPDLQMKNCSTERTPWWMGQFPDAVNSPGCDHHDSPGPPGSKPIVRPYLRDCRMERLSTDHFCSVCAYLLGEALKAFPPRATAPSAPTNLRKSGEIVLAASHSLATDGSAQAAAAQAADQRSVGVLVRLTAGGGPAKVQLVTDVAAPAVLIQRPVGNYLYQVTDAGRTVATSFLMGDPFERRAYPTGSGTHLTGRASSASVMIRIPRTTRAALRNRPVGLTIYRIDDIGRESSINAVVLDRLKAEGNAVVVGEVSSDSLLKAIDAAPARR
jgi:hypothetical protein